MCGRVWGLFGALLFLNAALGQVAFAQEKMTVVDLEKRTVEVPKNPERILCLGPGSLRLLPRRKKPCLLRLFFRLPKKRAPKSYRSLRRRSG